MITCEMLHRALLVLASALALTSGCAPSEAPLDAGPLRGDAQPVDAQRLDATGPDQDAGSSTDAMAGADAFAADAGAALPSFPDLEIGPYRSLLGVFRTSVARDADAYDTSSNYDHSAAQGYLLQAIGEVLWAARGYELEGRDALIEVALGEVEELRAAADRSVSGSPAFGLTDAWDAFGDGSVNPALTAYTWQSGMVALGVAKLARVLVEADHPAAASTRDFAVALVGFWDPYFTSVAEGGYWWYSAQSADAKAVHNTSVLIAMAAQLLAESGGPASLADRPRRCADLLWARMSGNPTTGYRWNYVDDGYPAASRRAEDSSHAAITLQFMRFARERDWWTNSQMQGVASTLLNTMWTGHPARVTGFVDGTRAPASEWSWTAAAVIGYAAHGDSPGGDPRVFESARSILFSSYLSRHERPFSGAVVDAARLLAVSLLLTRRPSAFASGSAYEVVAGPGDDVPLSDAALTADGGAARFYTVDWAPAADLSVGALTFPSRTSTAPSANLLVDLSPSHSGRVIVSLTYRSSVDQAVQQWDGTVYRTLATLPATLDEEGTLRFFRTTFELAADRFDYQPAVAGTNVLLQLPQSGTAVHRLEATPL